jgi:hypothetical protein
MKKKDVVMPSAVEKLKAQDSTWSPNDSIQKPTIARCIKHQSGKPEMKKKDILLSCRP